ncbi:MAG: polysaccharide deacetylase family protein [Fimbriimonadaceae bacterium]|nr:polysaccharide deacetylase family protein [Fimbriimonadaceae bacterium]
MSCWLRCWALFGCVAGAQAASGYLAAVTEAVTRAEAGQWDTASQAFGQASLLDPDDPLAYCGQGLTLLAARQVDTAAACFRRADETDRYDALAFCGLGLCYFEVGNLSSAESYFKRAAALDALLAPPAFYRGVMALCRGQVDEAGELFGRAAELGTDQVLLDHLTALRLLASGRWQAATEALRQLKPHVATSVPGLPAPLPLKLEGEPGKQVVLLVPERDPLSDRVAPRTAVEVVAPQPVRVGPLTVETPLPGTTVSGRVTIRVSLMQARSYKYVTILVDNKTKGITNREPYYVVWDTTSGADGPHEIVVRATGGIELEGRLTVNVQNRPQTTVTQPYDPAAYRTAARRIAALLQHASPPLSVERLLLTAYQQQDPEQALDLMERLYAKDPTRTELVDPLLALYRTMGLSYPVDRLPEPVRGVAGAGRVALTFDDGPRPEYTEPILKLLRQHKARGTFLVTGRMSEKYPELVRAIAADGHEIGSHTYNHLHLDGLTRDEIAYEMIKTKVVLDDIVGVSSRLMRPPGGHYNPKVREVLADLGYFPVFWTVNCASFSRLSAAEASAAISGKTHDGGILLLHNGADNTLSILPALLETLSRRGLRFVALSDLLRAPTESALMARPEFGPLPPAELVPYAGVE